MSEPRLVLVEWEDPTRSDSAWWSQDDALAEELQPTKNVGWLLQEDEKRVCLSARRSLRKGESEPYGWVSWIPKTLITRMVYLGEVNLLDGRITEQLIPGPERQEGREWNSDRLSVRAARQV